MTELKTKINEIIDDIKGRIRNPLILSFILVWLYQHWSLLYQMLTINVALPVESRLSLFKKYIEDHSGWYGMIGSPLIWSFISLACYYVIAIAAQAIKIYLGKRLNAFMLAKVDIGSFALKTELSEEKDNLKRVRKDLETNQVLLNSLAIERDSLDEKLQSVMKELNDKTRSLNFSENNILSNKNFQAKFEEVILFLLSQYADIKQEHIRRQEFHSNYFKVLNGSWSIHKNLLFSRNSGNTQNLKFNNEKVLQLSDDNYGDIFDFRFDKQYHILNFTIHINKDSNPLNQKKEKYVLIQINVDEFIGFCDMQFSHLKRHD
ncbi:MAG: hypothetical protein Q8R82_11950 [Hyphomonadaceae bacterium]|nr:hypothetical protein [Hyphomonadaceae bacterium]